MARKGGIRRWFYRKHQHGAALPSCWLNPNTVIWPFRELYAGDVRLEDRLVAISGPLRTEAESQTMDRYVRAGYRFLGVSSYQNFPRALVNPFEYEQAARFDFFREYAALCVGWMHCFRDPKAYLPCGLPRVFLAESDFTDARRIRPDRIDDVALPQDKAYDFAYVCGAGEWNAFCRNWKLAKRCLRLLADNGFTAAVFGRDSLEELAGSPGLTLYPYLPWYEFHQQLARCRRLLVPNVYDASPRLLAEALCQDIPLMVNRHILGGWHYVERPSGVFFSDARDFETALEKLLRRRLRPREYYSRLFGPDYARRRLAKFISRLRRRAEYPHRAQ